MRNTLSQQLFLSFALYIANLNSNFCDERISMALPADTPDYDEFYKPLRYTTNTFVS